MLADPGSRRTLLRVALAMLALSTLPTGLLAVLTPRGFFDGFPLGASWVDELPPYNAHLVGDVGGFQLAFGLLFAWAAIGPRRALVVPLCIAWTVSAVLHFGFHATHLEGFGAGDAVAQTVTLGLVLVLPVLCLGLRGAATPG